MVDSHTSDGQTKTGLNFPKYKRHEQTYTLKQLTEGKPQDYEVPI